MGIRDKGESEYLIMVNWYLRIVISDRFDVES